MKAISLHQPYASLVAAGVKTIETRSWKAPDALIDERVAIHAAAKRLPRWQHYTCSEDWWDGAPQWALLLRDAGEDPDGRSFDWLTCSDPDWAVAKARLPLGMVLATARLVDCVPMVAPSQVRVHDEASILVVGDVLRLYGEGLDASHRIVEDQRPYGEFTPGRYAWLLDEIEPLAEPIPCKGRQRLWNWDDPRWAVGAQG